jgi:hypothetical protein
MELNLKLFKLFGSVAFGLTLIKTASLCRFCAKFASLGTDYEQNLSGVSINLDKSISLGDFTRRQSVKEYLCLVLFLYITEIRKYN